MIFHSRQGFTMSSSKPNLFQTWQHDKGISNCACVTCICRCLHAPLGLKIQFFPILNRWNRRFKLCKGHLHLQIFSRRTHFKASFLAVQNPNLTKEVLPRVYPFLSCSRTKHLRTAICHIWTAFLLLMYSPPQYGPLTNKVSKVEGMIWWSNLQIQWLNIYVMRLFTTEVIINDSNCIGRWKRSKNIVKTVETR